MTKIHKIATQQWRRVRDPWGRITSQCGKDMQPERMTDDIDRVTCKMCQRMTPPSYIEDLTTLEREPK
jgi:hypothetical protein